MQAVVCHSYGGLDEARLEQIDAPPIRAGTVRIRVEACAASFASLLVMQGRHQNRVPLPLVAGTELAGVITEVGDGVTTLHVGDRVMAAVASGAYAQQAVVPTQTVFRLPNDLDFVRAAQLPTVYGTAYGTLQWRCRVQPGEVVVVHGAAGGSGLAAVQVARLLGARVIAVAGGARKAAALRELGADLVIDHQREDFRQAVLDATDGRGADVVYDPVGGEVLDRSLRCIAPDGRLVTMGFASGVIPQVPANLLLVKNVTLIGVYWGYYFGWAKFAPPPGIRSRLESAYQHLFDAIREGRIAPQTQAVLPLARFRAALTLIADREAIGRVVMQPFAGTG